MIYDDRPELPPRERAPLRLGDAISTAHFRMAAMLQAIHRDDELVERGLVELRPDPAHARSRVVAITQDGSARVDAMLGRERRWLADAMTRTRADPTEVERAAVLIEAFVRAMGETLGEPDADVAFGPARAHAQDDFPTIQRQLLAGRGRLGARPCLVPDPPTTPTRRRSSRPSGCGRPRCRVCRERAPGPHGTQSLSARAALRRAPSPSGARGDGRR